GLLGRTALRMDGRRAHALVETGAEPRGAGDVARLLPDLAHAAARDLVHEPGVDAGPLDQRGQYVTEQVRGELVRQTPAPLADGGSGGFDDHNVGHVHTPRSRRQ